MTVFETMQEEEIKIRTPLVLITDSWLWALILSKPLVSSWVGVQFLRHEHSSVQLFADCDLNYLSISSKLCLHIFYSSLVGRETQDFSQ